jgi:hypothetical protein
MLNVKCPMPKEVSRPNVKANEGGGGEEQVGLEAEGVDEGVEGEHGQKYLPMPPEGRFTAQA